MVAVVVVSLATFRGTQIDNNLLTHIPWWSQQRYDFRHFLSFFNRKKVTIPTNSHKTQYYTDDRARRENESNNPPLPSLPSSLHPLFPLLLPSSPFPRSSFYMRLEVLGRSQPRLPAINCRFLVTPSLLLCCPSIAVSPLPSHTFPV